MPECGNWSRLWWAPLRNLFGEVRPCDSCAAKIISAAKHSRREMICPDMCAGECPRRVWKRDGNWRVADVAKSSCKAVPRGMVALLEHGDRHMVTSVTIAIGEQ